MTRTLGRGLLLLLLAGGGTWTAAAQERGVRVVKPAAPAAPTPKLVVVAETKLLMEGFTHANYQGLERNLTQKPADAETWTFVRGQALLVAESGNLLMMRPPRNQGQDAWMQRATDLRDKATELARQAGNRDYERSRVALQNVATSCNRCHQTFRVPVQIGPPGEKGDRKAERSAE